MFVWSSDETTIDQDSIDQIMLEEAFSTVGAFEAYTGQLLEGSEDCQGEHYLFHFGSTLQLLITATATTTLSIEDAKTTEDFLDLERTLGDP